MRITKKVVSPLLAFVMVLGLLPAAATATESQSVYISVSFDGQYIADKNGDPIVYVPVSFEEVASVDLDAYGLSDYLYDPDGDGTNEITALQLIIYAHENIYGGSWSDVNFTGGAGSSYFQDGIFGFTENLNYFVNGEFPIDEALSEGSSFACLSAMQHDNGTFASGGAECSESCVWVMVAAATWGINPNTDTRFVKNGNSVMDALLTHYVEAEAMFQHVVGAGSNAMATDQSCYALVAYDRLLNGQPALYDYSDVTFEAPAPKEMTAALGLPAEINGGDSFNGIISVNKWDNEAAYKLIDFIVTVPEGDAPTDADILILNVNGDSRINTFDALGIVEAFVNKTDYIVVTKAATITAQ